MSSNTLESLMPRDVAHKAEDAGVIKANLDLGSTLMLSLLAGAFIGFGAVFSTTVMTGNGLDGAIKLPFGVMRLLGGASFCLGLILVTIAGAEMFTGNVLLVMAAASRKISARRVLRNWGIVLLGNFIGATGTAYLIYLTGQYGLMHGQVGKLALDIAEGKCALAFHEALTRAVFCNILVCLAIWLSMTGRATVDKVAVILFPITAFVTSGFEHSVANMYFMGIALFIKSGADPAYWQMIGAAPEQYPHLEWGRYLAGNLLPVILGNTLGGLAVGLMYWAIYCRSNLMMYADNTELLRRLTREGRRQPKRVPVEGMISLRYGSHEFHGRMKAVGEQDLTAEFYAAEGLPVVLDAVEFDLDANEGVLKLARLPGVIHNSAGGKNLMGRDFFTFTLKYGKLADEDRQTLARFVAGVESATRAEGEAKAAAAAME
jgi:formate/nitrite transporter